MIDLHCHSNFSDGVLSPEDLFSKALVSNIKMLALTDHDTIAGLAALHCVNNAHGTPIKIINGIELSTRWKKHEIHILGLNFNLDDDLLHRLIERQQASRKWRAQKIGSILANYGVENAFEKACKVAGHEHIGRPHFAQVLINEGITHDIQSGFNRLLARGRAAYVPTPWLTIDEVVEGVMHAGGDAVIAHPLKYALTRTKLHELIIDFKSAKGAGIEVVSGSMTAIQIQEVAALCKRYDLFASSGSDFHRDAMSRIGLGQQPQLPLNCIPIWHQWTS